MFLYRLINSHTHTHTLKHQNDYRPSNTGVHYCSILFQKQRNQTNLNPFHDCVHSIKALTSDVSLTSRSKWYTNHTATCLPEHRHILQRSPMPLWQVNKHKPFLKSGNDKPYPDTSIHPSITTSTLPLNCLSCLTPSLVWCHCREWQK